MKNKEYKNAIHEFENSYNSLSKYKLMDKFRYLLLLSSSRISYREIALFNIAHCYLQIGNREKAEEYCRKIDEEFPDGKIVKLAADIVKSNANDSI